jgi:hypothetical protein
MTLGLMTLSIMTLGIATPSIMTQGFQICAYFFYLAVVVVEFLAIL